MHLKTGLQSTYLYSWHNLKLFKVNLLIPPGISLQHCLSNPILWKTRRISEGEQYAGLFYSHCVFVILFFCFSLISVPPLLPLLVSYSVLVKWLHFLLFWTVKLKGVGVCMKAQPNECMPEKTSRKYKFNEKHNIQAASGLNRRIDGKNDGILAHFYATSEAHWIGKWQSNGIFCIIF